MRLHLASARPVRRRLGDDDGDGDADDGRCAASAPATAPHPMAFIAAGVNAARQIRSRLMSPRKRPNGEPDSTALRG